MLRKVVLVILFIVPLFAEENLSIAKIRAEKSDQALKIDVLIQHPKTQSNFLVKVDGNKIFDLSVNPLNQKKFASFFLNKNFEGKDIEFSLPENYIYQDINRSLDKRKINQAIPLNVKKTQIKLSDSSYENPKIWTLSNIEEIEELLYGNIHTLHNQIKICAPENITGNIVNIRVESKLNLESVLILTTANNFPAVAMIQLFHNTTLEKIHFFMHKAGKIIIMGKDDKGKIYKVTHNVTMIHDLENINEVCHY